MRIYMNQNGIRRIHIEDSDDYEVTDDNGVDFWPTKAQIDRIVKKAEKPSGTHTIEGGMRKV